MKNITKYPVVILFGFLLFFISIADLFSPVKEKSELENRELETFPEFSYKSLIENKYTPKIETFTTDHFILRDSWISLKSVCESLIGKKENNGVVYGKDGYLFTKFLPVKSGDFSDDFTKTADKSYEQMAVNISRINKFSERHSDRKISFLLAPTAPGVMTDKVLQDSPVIDTDYILGYAGKNLKNINFIDIQDKMKEHSDEYIYYRADHHWTTQGAYYGYEAYMNSVNRPAQPRDSFEYMSVDNFLGTHYSKSKNFDIVPDVMSYIKSDAQITIGEKTDSIYDYSKLDERDKYAMFLHGNPGFATIKGDGQGKIMIIKDSYANCFIPYLIDSYRQIDVIDLRYIAIGLDKIIAENNYDEILFLYNCETFINDTNLTKVNLFNN